MCGLKPCFNSVCGISLKISVLVISIIEFIITVVATTLNVIKYARKDSYYVNNECGDDVDVCFGPLIKYSVFDGIFGVVSSFLLFCSLRLICGTRRSKCLLLITWLIVTFFASLKYIWVVVTHDWTSLEDWISISYLLFYIISYSIVYSYLSQLWHDRDSGDLYEEPACGTSLKTLVFIIGVIQIIITVIATVLNVIKFARTDDYVNNECNEDVDVCVGPLIKYSVFDALFGILCGLLLIFGSRNRSSCLLITWLLTTILTSIKYIWVVATHDWTSLEDWISIAYLLFYMFSLGIVMSFLSETKRTPGMILSRTEPVPGNAAPKQTYHQSPLVYSQTFPPVQPYQQYPQGHPPDPQYPQHPPDPQYPQHPPQPAAYPYPHVAPLQEQNQNSYQPLYPQLNQLPPQEHHL